jgi:hypothetical protein
MNAIDAAKAALAPNYPPSAWLTNHDEDDQIISIEHESGSVTISVVRKNDGEQENSTATFVDNTIRYPVSNFGEYGDDLPLEPMVLTGCCDHWNAFASTTSWSIANLAERLTPDTKLSIDGGPYFARMSLNSSRVTMAEYATYCSNNNNNNNNNNETEVPAADNDIAPLYLFDPDVLTSTFANGSMVSDDYQIPDCFAHDVMAGLTGTRFRPLPPAWLLVGVKRSGTPIHDHPLFVAWNALLVGCKLWCCFPPNVDESVLQLLGDARSSSSSSSSSSCSNNDDQNDEDDDYEFDTSALQWFANCGKLPDSATIIIQQPGEVAYVPPTWWHVVLNVETSTAICYSLTLRRDIPRLFPSLLESDEDFALAWRDWCAQAADSSFATRACYSSMVEARATKRVRKVHRDNI